ncbi:hypothetical protein Tco_1338961 [Tanacetum coccineum]
MMIIVLEEGMNVEALQTKYLIIDWEIYAEGTRKLKDQEDKVFGYILLMNIKLLIKKLEDSEVMIVTTAGYVSTACEVQRKYSKSLLLLVLKLLLLVLVTTARRVFAVRV